MENKNFNEIENDIKNLVGLNKDLRKIAIKEIALNLYSEFKRFGYKQVDRKFLMSFFTDLKPNAKFNGFRDVKNYLVSKNLIALSKREKTKQRLRDVPLFSYMTKSGESVTYSPLSRVVRTEKYDIQSYIIL